GFHISAHDYLQALRLRGRFTREFVREVFEEVDALVLPVIPEPAPALEAVTAGTAAAVVALMGRCSPPTPPLHPGAVSPLPPPCPAGPPPAAARSAPSASGGRSTRGPCSAWATPTSVAERPPIWPVFVAYVGAFAAIVVFSIFALGAVHAMYPDLPESAVFETLPGLLAMAIASSTGLLVTVLLVDRGTSLARLRLLPARETGWTLSVMVIGMLALAQLLDSLAILAGLGQHGTMVMIRRALAQAVGPDLFLAVLVIGVLAGSAEEIFFRGYM